VLIPQPPVPGIAVRINASKHKEIANKENMKPAVVVVEHENEKKKTTKLRSINSKVDTYRHPLYSQTDWRNKLCRTTTRSSYTRDQPGTELPFTRKYSVGSELGQGGFGVVYAGIRMEDGAPVAVKHVPRCKIVDWTEVNGNKVPSELRLLLDVQAVPGVVQLLDFYERKDSFIYVMVKPHNYMDMFDFITNEKILTETVARNFFSQVLDTVIACHDRGIVHRDIKDENLLVDLTNHKVTLIDFGSGGFLQRGDYHVFDGTRVYAPPEWIRDGRYRWEGLTVWSLGILLFDMVVGDVPFQKDEDICQARLRFPVGLSRGVTSLIQGCLQPDERRRLRMEEVRSHAWVRGERRGCASESEGSL